MKQLFLIFCAVCALFVTSCQKSIEQVSTDETQKASPTKYQIDGQEVAQEDFFKQLLPGNQVSLRDVTTDMTTIANAYRVLCETGRLIGKQRYNIVNVFTSNDEFYKYADVNSHPNERTYDLVENDLANYAVSSGAIKSFEATGVVPQSYIDYMDAYLAKYGFATSTAPQVQIRTLASSVYKDCRGGGSSWLVRTNPALAMFGFNNNISSYSPVGFTGGRSDVFDLSFFRSRLAGIWSWDSNNFDFCTSPFTFLNDRATSWGTLGIL